MKHTRVNRIAICCLLLWGGACRAESELRTVDPKTAEGLRKLLGYDGQSLHLVSAHRGGPREGFPENCIATFEDTLRHTHAMMEIDPRYTKDGVIVLHHDATLERTTNGTGRVADRTYEELKALRLKDPKGNVTQYSMPTLDEALEWARGKTVLVLDQKDVPVEVRAQKVTEHEAQAYAVLIVYSFADAERCHAMNEDIMMEVMIPNRKQVEAFDRTGVPWSNIVAFVGHSPPQEADLCAIIHAKGAICIGGTSRNLDREFIEGRVTDLRDLRRDYHALLESGIDLIETDLPREVGPLLYREQAIPASRTPLLHDALR